jgi:hypothetical protein
MGALMNENPPYTMAFRNQGARVEETVGRSEMRTRVEGLRRMISAGRITDMVVTNRHGEDVTVDWFG